MHTKTKKQFKLKKYPFIIAGIEIMLITTLAVFLAYPGQTQAAVKTWDGGGADGTCGGGAGDGNKWSCALNWSGDSLPTSSDVATFDATSTKDATIDASFAGSVAGINILSGYTGTITQARSLTVGASGYSQAAGTFTGGSADITITTGAFTLTGGTFTSTTGNFSVYGNWTHTVGGTFNHNNGTVTYTRPASTTWDVNSTETLNNFTMNGTGTLNFASGDTIIVLGTFNHSNGSLNTGTIEARGNVTVSAAASGGGGTISFLVAGDQTITGEAGYLPNININKPSGTVSASGTSPGV